MAAPGNIPVLPPELHIHILSFGSQAQTPYISLVCKEWAGILAGRRVEPYEWREVAPLFVSSIERANFAFDVDPVRFLVAACGPGSPGIVAHLLHRFNTEHGGEQGTCHCAMTDAAAAGGNVPVLAFLEENGAFDIRYSARDALCKAAESGSVDTVEFLFARGARGIPTEACASASADMIGHLMTRYTELSLADGGMSMPIDWSYRGMTMAAATGGNVPVLRLLEERGALDFPQNNKAMDAAAKSGSLEALRFLVRVSPTPPDEKTAAAAASVGSVPMLRFLRLNGCPMGKLVVRSAACEGHIPAIQYLLSIGAPAERFAIDCAVEGNHLSAARLLFSAGAQLHSGTLLTACRAGNLAVVQWLCESGCPMVAGAAEHAAYKGHVEILRRLLEARCPLTESVLADMAKRGDLEMCTLLWHAGCPAGAMSILFAAREGHTAVVFFLHERFFPWATAVMAAAIEGSNLDTVARLHQAGCPWDKQCMRRAEETRDFEFSNRMKFEEALRVVDYLRTNGCPG